MTIRPPAFEFHNGRTARSAADLLLILEEGPAELWSDHVSHERNDFASWARSGLHEAALSERLREVKTREETLKVLRHWIEPSIARKATTHGHFATDFFLGLTIGIIIGIVVIKIVMFS